MDLIMLIILLALLLFVIIAAISSVFVVRQQTAAIIERLGRFNRVAGAGLRFKIPFVERIAGRITLQIDQLMVKVETKTEDNVFVTIPVAVQFLVQPDKVFEAFYKLKEPQVQIQSFVLDVVRGKVPEIKLDELFKSKDDVAKEVKERLTAIMGDYGYSIVQTLVTDIDPEAKVKASMNEINAAQRLRVAAAEKAEADKILKVKAAEGEAEAMRLHGQGIANQRAEITQGLSRSVKELKEAANKLDDQEIMATIMMAQYFDTVKDLAAKSDSRTILFPHNPGSMQDLWQQMTLSSATTATDKAKTTAKN